MGDEEAKTSIEGLNLLDSNNKNLEALQKSTYKKMNGEMYMCRDKN